MVVLYENGVVMNAATNVAGIYYWKNNISGHGYVGMSIHIRKRVLNYVNLRFDGQKKFYDAVKSYGLENFICYKMMDCCPSRIAMEYWERYWIKELDTFGPGGYNLTPGGGYRDWTVDQRNLHANRIKDGLRRITEASESYRPSEFILNYRVQQELLRKNMLLNKGLLYKEFFLFGNKNRFGFYKM